MSRYNMHDIGSHTSWEDLRRQACYLENEIDLKLVQFSKLGTNYSCLKTYSTAHSGDRSSTVQLAENMAKDLQQLISQLTKVNERMSSHVNSLGGGGGGTLQHTLQRHWDIVQDYDQEFNKISSNITAFRDRERLMGSVDHEIRIGSSSGVDMYLKEHEHLLRHDTMRSGKVLDSMQEIPGVILGNSASMICSLGFKSVVNLERLIDEQIGLAAATKENMLTQKAALYGVTGKLNTLTNRFPAINNLIQRINFHKRRDTFIIGAVIGVCLIFLLWYSFH